MEQFIRMLMAHLVSKEMEVTSIPALIRNVANTIVANHSMSLEDLNDHLRSLGGDDFDLDAYTFYIVMAIFESDLAERQIYFLDLSFNQQGLHKISNRKERILPIQADNHNSLQE